MQYREISSKPRMFNWRADYRLVLLYGDITGNSDLKVNMDNRKIMSKGICTILCVKPWVNPMQPSLKPI